MVVFLLFLSGCSILLIMLLLISVCKFWGVFMEFCGWGWC